MKWIGSARENGWSIGLVGILTQVHHAVKV